MSKDASVGQGRRSRRARSRRVILPFAAVLLVVGAFLLWGPIGLGSGPLSVQMGSTVGGVDEGDGPVGFLIPLYNSGDKPAVVDGVDLVGGTHYPAPRLLGLDVLTDATCGGSWPARAEGSAFTMVGCGGRIRGALIGRDIGNTHGNWHGVPAAAEASAPPRGGCWVMTEVIIHYHVGIRHYSATDLYEQAVCTKDAQVNAAMNAAGLVGG